MRFHAPDVHRAAASRDAAIARLRRGTGVVAGACVALTAAFAALAAGFTTGRHQAPPIRPAQRTGAAPVTAPAPSLVPFGSDEGAASSTPAASATPPPVSAAPPAAAPVVVSGGS